MRNKFKNERSQLNILGTNNEESPTKKPYVNPKLLRELTAFDPIRRNNTYVEESLQ